MKLYELDRELYDRIVTTHDPQWPNPSPIRIPSWADWYVFQEENGVIQKIRSSSTNTVYIEILNEDVFILTLLKYS